VISLRDYRPSNMSSMRPFSTAAQSTFPPLAYTLSYDDMLTLEKNGTKSRMLSICRTEFSKGRRMGRWLPKVAMYAEGLMISPFVAGGSWKVVG
jgi:hypothetical protein